MNKELYELEQDGKKYKILRPTRDMRTRAEIFRSVQLSEYVKKGILTKAQFRKRYVNDKGVLSDEEQEEFQKAVLEYRDLETKYQKRESAIAENPLTDKEKEEQEALFLKVFPLRVKLNQYLEFEESMYDYSAESLANKDGQKWYLHHLCVNEDGSPIFTGSTFDERMKSYDKIADENSDLLLRLEVLVDQYSKGNIDGDNPDSWKGQDEYILELFKDAAKDS